MKTFYDNYDQLVWAKLITSGICLVCAFIILLLFSVWIVVNAWLLYKNTISLFRAIKYEWKNRNTIY